MTSLGKFIKSTLAICLAMPALAQEAPPATVMAIKSTNSNFVQKWNKQEPAALAALFTSSALFVAPNGVSNGQSGVQKYYETLFTTVHPSSDFVHDVDRVEMLSIDLAMASGSWNLSRPALKGFWSAVYERRGDAWPMREHSYNITPPAAAAPGASPSPR